jgi:octaprenyl-diphosphate synthase
MILDDIRVFLGDEWVKTNDLIKRSLESDIDILNKTNEMLFQNSGKRLRPMVTLLCARLCSGGRTTMDSIRFAAATELLHNATLLHDDVADNSTERRGKPTVMSLLGGNSSVLLGDYWLVKAVNNILDTSDPQRVTRIFARTLSDLAEGEMLQLQKSWTGDTSEDDYLRIIFNKTASLFCAAAISGAISVGAAKTQEDAVREYARNLGLAFQIKDDMFDYSGDAAIGKPVGIDLDEQKITLPLLCALRSVSAEEEASIRQKVVKIHENPAFKEDITRIVLEHNGLEGAAAKLDEYVEAAVEALSDFPASKEKEYLIDIAKFTGERNK